MLEIFQKMTKNMVTVTDFFEGSNMSSVTVIKQTKKDKTTKSQKVYGADRSRENSHWGCLHYNLSHLGGRTSLKSI